MSAPQEAPTAEHEDLDRIAVELPPSARWIRLARLMVTSIANDAGFDTDTVEDARVAIDEACGLFVERHASSALRIAFVPTPDVLTIEISAAVPSDRTDPSGLAAEVLDAVTSTWTWIVEADRAALRLTVG